MTARITPLAQPYPKKVEKRLKKLMPEGIAPLSLFTMLARDIRLFEKFMAGGLLDKGHLTLRQREIIIDRVTAQCGSEYEWGVHMAFFARQAEFSDAEIYAIVHGGAEDPCWTDPTESLLVALCDALHEVCQIDDRLWRKLTQAFSDEAVLEMIMLCGFYRTVSYLTNGTKLPLEPYAARFPART